MPEKTSGPLPRLRGLPPVDELANVLGTLLAELKALGVIS